MMLQVVIAIARSLIGGLRSSFRFTVLQFVGVAWFPSPAI